MLGDKIKELRENKNLTQSQLSKILGVSPSTIGMWEQNRRSPDNESLKKIADLFDVSIDSLLGRSEYVYYNSLTKDSNLQSKNKIKELRQAKGWTQDELADKLHVKRAAISKYESSKIPLTADTIRKLSEIFNKSTDYILGLTDDKENDNIDKINIPKEYADKYKVTSRDKKQYLEEMKKANEAFFMNDELNDEAKKEMLDLMSELFWEAKTMNKRKK